MPIPLQFITSNITSDLRRIAILYASTVVVVVVVAVVGVIAVVVSVVATTSCIAIC